MKKETSAYISIMSLVTVMVIVATAFVVYAIAYKNGQIDAALGKQNYHLVMKADSTVVWEKKEQKDDYDWPPNPQIRMEPSVGPGLLPSTKETGKK